MSVETKLMTADELLAMPDGFGQRHELVKGELITLSPAGWDHGVIAGRISHHLGQYAAARNLGTAPSSDTGYLIARNPDTVLQPDASFVRAERVISSRKYFPGAPDVAVEVISPTDRYTEVRAKVRDYLQAGARMVIVIDPDEQAATVSTRSGTIELTIEDTLDGGDVVPGWKLPLRDIFAD